MEEERDIPSIIRKHFTKEEEDVIVGKTIRNGGLFAMRNELTAILVAMDDWATPQFIDAFRSEIPPPVKHLVLNYHMNDYEHVICAKRDSPLLTSKPRLAPTKCFKIPFCFPCIC